MSEEIEKKTWEKERRDRMREAFSTLEKLLPSYDPSNVLTRITILNESIEYIQDMQDRVDELLQPKSEMTSEEDDNLLRSIPIQSNKCTEAIPDKQVPITAETEVSRSVVDSKIMKVKKIGTGPTGRKSLRKFKKLSHRRKMNV
ncbi:hypothetical protein WA026_022541 [Henosepilachna vigintioctopunctata]|uniref:BHLH domain-containing protein n=1 Tax=Henosepilachna vigintioctopunctata TaxID=420089 RepID=A0AAW1VFR0_9CUCU